MLQVDALNEHSIRSRGCGYVPLRSAFPVLDAHKQLHLILLAILPKP